VNTPARRREVTADGMTRVAAVVAAMAESSAGGADGAALTDLIAKAAQEVDRHAGAARMLRVRGLESRGRSPASLKAAHGAAVDAPARTLDVVR